MLDGFKKFILRGNVVDMAVGVVIGAAFGGVVTALTTDLLTPLIAALVGKPDFSAIQFSVRGSLFPLGHFILDFEDKLSSDHCVNSYSTLHGLENRPKHLLLKRVRTFKAQLAHRFKLNTSALVSVNTVLTIIVPEGFLSKLRVPVLTLVFPINVIITVHARLVG